MSQIEKLGITLGSRRYARDLIDTNHTIYTRPWWGEYPVRGWDAVPPAPLPSPDIVRAAISRHSTKYRLDIK